jgi:hypothetical protein
LRVIAGRGADDAPGQFVLRQAGDLVVGAADLERKHRLQVLALQQHGPVEPGRQAAQRIKRGLLRHVIDAGGEDAADGVLHQNVGRGVGEEMKSPFV